MAFLEAERIKREVVFRDADFGRCAACGAMVPVRRVDTAVIPSETPDLCFCTCGAVFEADPEKREVDPCDFW